VPFTRNRPQAGSGAAGKYDWNQHGRRSSGVGKKTAFYRTAAYLSHMTQLIGSYLIDMPD
jgi:hypothetical protein